MDPMGITIALISFDTDEPADFVCTGYTSARGMDTATTAPPRDFAETDLARRSAFAEPGQLPWNTVKHGSLILIGSWCAWINAALL
jgi:hypothetical protein